MISEIAKCLWKISSWIRRGRTEREKAEAQNDIATAVERGYQQKTKEEKRRVMREFLELHYPYLLQFVQKESKSVDFVNVHLADAARNIFPAAVHGETRYKELDSVSKEEVFPSTALTTLEEVIQWEQLQEDLPVYDLLEFYLRARASYNRKRERMKGELIRTITERPSTLIRDFDDSSVKEDKEEIIRSIQRSPEKFAEDILNNRGYRHSLVQYAKGSRESYHNSFIEHIRSLWLYKDDFEELDEYTSEMESSFDALYNWRTEIDRTTEEHEHERIEYGLLTDLYEELRSRYYFSESSLQPVDPEEIAATEVEEYYYNDR